MVEHNLLIESVLNDPAMIGENIKWGSLKLFVEMGEARAGLDEGNHMQAKEIALLAGITERSVQNAFSLKGAAQLKAEKRDGVSWVTAEEARRWLSDKKRFIPTSRIRFNADEPIPEKLQSQAELRAFLLPRITKMFGDDLGKISIGLGMTEAEVADKLSGRSTIDLSDALGFARALNIESKWLASQILRINNPKEADILLA